MKYCADCKLFGTNKCPPSRLCYAIGNKPHFKPKFKDFIKHILYEKICSIFRR